MALDAYRRKRDFGRTPEPSGTVGEPGRSADGADTRASSERPEIERGLLYIVQKHAARRLHYDLRLELDGVLLSWAVPKGPSFDPGDRRLAARVEDHPLEYGGFEGTIPEGEYGAGTVELWDRGAWQPEGDPHQGLEKGDLKFTLHGEKLQGSWVLVRMKRRPGQGDKEQWLLIKHRDEYAVDEGGDAVLDEQPRSVASGRTLEEIAGQAEASVWHGDRPADQQSDAHPGEEFRLDPSLVNGAKRAATLPRFIRPELAKLVDRSPVGDQWLHEVKFDGYRIISRIETGTVKLYTRNEQDWTSRYKVLAEQLARLPVEDAVLDGEVVVQLPDGTTSFQALQDPGREEASEAGGRLVYYVFDLLHLNGYNLLDAAIQDRKELLRRLLPGGSKGGCVLFSEHVSGQKEGADLLEHACGFGLEGVVSKAAHTRYRPGTRGNDWLKTKCRHEQEFVIGGYTDPAATRAGFGALLLGVHENGELRYVGKVGSATEEHRDRRLSVRPRSEEASVRPLGQAGTSGRGRLLGVDSRWSHPPPQLQGAARRQASRAGGP